MKAEGVAIGFLGSLGKRKSAGHAEVLSVLELTSVRLPVISTANRPPASEFLRGVMILNETTNRVQVCTGLAWKNLATIS